MNYISSMQPTDNRILVEKMQGIEAEKNCAADTDTTPCSKLGLCHQQRRQEYLGEPRGRSLVCAAAVSHALLRR